MTGVQPRPLRARGRAVSRFFFALHVFNVAVGALLAQVYFEGNNVPVAGFYFASVLLNFGCAVARIREGRR